MRRLYSPKIRNGFETYWAIAVPGHPHRACTPIRSFTLNRRRLPRGAGSSHRQNRGNTQGRRFHDGDLVSSDKVHVTSPFRVQSKELRWKRMDNYVGRRNTSAREPEMRVGKRCGLLRHDRRPDCVRSCSAPNWSIDCAAPSFMTARSTAHAITAGDKFIVHLRGVVHSDFRICRENAEFARMFRSCDRDSDLATAIRIAIDQIRIRLGLRLLVQRRVHKILLLPRDYHVERCWN